MPSSEAEDPLLPSVGRGAAPGRAAVRSTMVMCTFNLVKAIIGAGMMAIPRAYFMMGWVLGSTILLLVAYLTYWTLAVLLEGTEKTGAVTYVGLAQQLTGKGVAYVLQLALLLFCFGFLVVYLVVMGDLLVGTPGLCNGLLCELLGVTGGLWLNRSFILLLVSSCVCAPLMALRSMKHLSVSNLVGVLAIALLTLLCIALGLAAVATGQAQPLAAWPQMAAFGSSPGDQLLGLASVVPVVLSCYVAHQNLHPVLPLLVPYSTGRMRAVLALALLLAAACFFSMSLGTGLAFGSGLNANVLNNLYVEGMQGFLGRPAAVAATLVVRGGYLLSLLASTLLYMFPLRICTAELVFDLLTSRGSSSSSRGAAAAAAAAEGPGDEQQQLIGPDNSSSSSSVPAPQGSALQAAAAAADGLEDPRSEEVRASSGLEDFEQRWFYAFTYGLLGFATLVAVAVPNIWIALSAIGDCATTVEAFIVPGLIALALLKAGRAAGTSNVPGGKRSSLLGRGLYSGLAVFVIVLGVLLFLNGILIRVLRFR